MATSDNGMWYVFLPFYNSPSAAKLFGCALTLDVLKWSMEL
jgi:hypothetical protein